MSMSMYFLLLCATPIQLLYPCSIFVSTFCLSISHLLHLHIPLPRIPIFSSKPTVSLSLVLCHVSTPFRPLLIILLPITHLPPQSLPDPTSHTSAYPPTHPAHPTTHAHTLHTTRPSPRMILHHSTTISYIILDAHHFVMALLFASQLCMYQ